MGGRALVHEYNGMGPQEEMGDVLISRDVPSLSEWAEERYILPPETAELSGPWSNDYVPYLMEPMRWLSDMATRQVTLCACTQSAKTELGNILIGRTIDVNPAPTLIVMPRENDANRRIATRLRPMFRSTPSLLTHLGGKLDNLNIGKETILDSMILYIAWANSPAALADNPVCIVILDEAGKFPQSTGKEADPYSLSKKRQRTFRTRSKLLITSSPVGEGDIFDAEFMKGDMNEWFVRDTATGTPRKPFVHEGRYERMVCEVSLLRCLSHYETGQFEDRQNQIGRLAPSGSLSGRGSCEICLPGV